MALKNNTLNGHDERVAPSSTQPEIRRHYPTSRRKSEASANFTPFFKIPLRNGFFIAELVDGGFIAHTQWGVFQNPWTNKPFSTLKSCRLSMLRIEKKGYFPKFKKYSLESFSLSITKFLIK